ncbi:helix-turn-helix domain-containing protein [Synechococcus sp. HK01-R]|uniref:MarR family transcriptional regulator n=1 Tax=Synechococcus sp. HK01-R TaxID=2751171 RepID=UPI0016248A06|nr:helix-turn-helix domain-containing protein [Synechococcus sp. HK01-R]QNG26102.1 MarR family transcriptional regulator [Synechococcus sp. HK01-R]
MTTTPPRIELSPQECRLFAHLKRCKQWQTARQIADATGVAPRTVQGHTKRLSACGLLERMETHPAPMFRFTAESAQADPAYVARIANACEAFGVEF